MMALREFRRQARDEGLRGVGDSYYDRVIAESATWPKRLRTLLFAAPERLPPALLSRVEDIYTEHLRGVLTNGTKQKNTVGDPADLRK